MKEYMQANEGMKRRDLIQQFHVMSLEKESTHKHNSLKQNPPKIHFKVYHRQKNVSQRSPKASYL